MTRKGRGQAVVARSILLLASVLFVFGGCAGTEAPRPVVDRTTTMSSDPQTEAQLLAELNKKFENPQAHYQLADLYRRSRNWNMAEYHYITAISQEPGNKAAQAGLVKMFVERGERAKAEQFANAYITQSGVAVADRLRLGYEFEKVGLDDYALRAYRQAVAAAPDSAEANRQIGYYYRAKGDTANAKKYLQRSFELNPRQPDVAGDLGRMGVVVQTPGVPEGPLEQKSTQ
jgi:tetratricopeptide (TPR) repeat protein